MTDGHPLLRAILNNKGEDTPKLMYADWLEENGRFAEAAVYRHKPTVRFYRRMEQLLMTDKDKHTDVMSVKGAYDILVKLGHRQDLRLKEYSVRLGVVVGVCLEGTPSRYWVRLMRRVGKVFPHLQMLGVDVDNTTEADQLFRWSTTVLPLDVKFGMMLGQNEYWQWCRRRWVFYDRK
jgi:uncharacterized protein (TIGR02996 family)